MLGAEHGAGLLPLMIDARNEAFHGRHGCVRVVVCGREEAEDCGGPESEVL